MFAKVSGKSFTSLWLLFRLGPYVFAAIQLPIVKNGAENAKKTQKSIQNCKTCRIMLREIMFVKFCKLKKSDILGGV